MFHTQRILSSALGIAVLQNCILHQLLTSPHCLGINKISVSQLTKDPQLFLRRFHCSSNTQPFLNTLPLSRASPPSLKKYQSASSHEAQAKGVPRPTTLLITTADMPPKANDDISTTADAQQPQH
jgi:hypothetical protein